MQRILTFFFKKNVAGTRQNDAGTERQVYFGLSSDREQVPKAHGRTEEQHGPEEQSRSGRNRSEKEQENSGDHRRPQQCVQQSKRALQRYNRQQFDVDW